MLIIILIISILNFVLLISIGFYLVRLKERINGIFSDLFTDFLGRPEPVLPDKRPKSWDQKYEESLEYIASFSKNDSGLKDLPEKMDVSWGVPPAPKKIPDLIIQKDE